MSKQRKLLKLRENITDNAIKIKYLLRCAIYKPDSERETFILGEMALEMVEKIKMNSENIGKILKH